MEGKNLLNGYELLGIAAIGAILILSVLLSGCLETGNQTGENSKVNVTDENKASSVKDINSCLGKHDLSSDTIAFYEVSWCPHCKKMKPWVKELENKGYKFLWAQEDSKDPAIYTTMKIVEECYKDTIHFHQGFPQFGCAANGQSHIGEFGNIDAMKNFADECRKAANKAINK